MANQPTSLGLFPASSPLASVSCDNRLRQSRLEYYTASSAVQRHVRITSAGSYNLKKTSKHIQKDHIIFPVCE